jgi:hypothetical protein
MSGPYQTPAGSTGPVPYELYIRLDALAASWPDEGDTWPGAVVACCGFQAAELSLRLVDDAWSDGRAAAFPQRRVARFVEHLGEGLELTCRLLRRCGPPAPAATLDPGGTPSPGLAVLSRLDAGHVDTITRQFALAAAGMPFRIGIEGQLDEARRQHGLPVLGAADGPPAVPAMDYTAVVVPTAAFALRESTPCGPEDHLFSTAHQITECWLSIAHHLLDEATAHASRGRWVAAAEALRHGRETLALAMKAGQLLDLMVLADYHPLRVRLRDGSGAQSRAMRQLRPAVRAAARPLWTELEARGLGLLDILEQPAAHLELYGYLTDLEAAGKRIQGFLFEHYLLALGVLGTHSLGSAGYEIRKLAERASQPVFPEINTLHHDYVMITNFRHGESAGSIVLRNELARGWNPYQVIDHPQVCPRDTIEARIADYFRFIEQRKGDEWVELFDPVRGQLEDVPGTRPFLGEAHLRIFINGMFNAFTDLRATCSPPQIDGNAASVDWRFDAVSYNGQPIVFAGREDFTFTGDGRILRAVADWSPALVAQQWREQRHREHQWREQLGRDQRRRDRQGTTRRPAPVPRPRRAAVPDRRGVPHRPA